MALRMVVIVLLLLALRPGEARGLVILLPTARSVDWYVADSDVIAVGKITARDPSLSDAKNHFVVYTVSVRESIKGPVKKGEALKFAARNMDPPPPDSEYLFCLVDSERHIAERKMLAEQWRGAPWAMRDFRDVEPLLVDGRPQRRPLFVIGDQVRDVKRDTLKHFRELARDQPKGVTGEIELSMGSGRFAPPEGHYTGRVTAPLTPRMRDAAMTWVTSADPIDRYNGLLVLSHFKSDQAIAVMRALLNDPFTNAHDNWPNEMSGFPMIRRPWFKWDGTPYPLRGRAWQTLQRWGADERSATISQPKYAARGLPGGLVIGLLAALAIMLAGVSARGWRAVGVGGRPRLFAGFGGVCLILLMVTIGLWIRSAWRIDELVFRAGEARVETALLPGGVRLLAFEKWNEPFAMSFTTVPRAAAALADWRWADPANPKPPQRRGALGFWRDEEALPDYAAARTYRAWTVPYWALVSVLAVPLLWRVWRIVRYRVLLPGHCRNCGYDMRATPDRCPECGTQITQTPTPARSSG